MPNVVIANPKNPETFGIINPVSKPVKIALRSYPLRLVERPVCAAPASAACALLHDAAATRSGCCGKAV